MIEFNDLRISPDGTELYIDAVISPYDYYEGEYIESIEIKNSKGEKIYLETVSKEEQGKQYSIILTPDKTGNVEGETERISTFNNDIFYITLAVGGLPASTTECEWDKSKSLGIALNWYPIYKMGMKHIKEITKVCNCKMPKYFIDYILRLKSLQLALKTANYELANSIYNKWFIEESMSNSSISTCNCG